ncbi:MAG TPA: hypothetical protein VI229_00330 [Burkholderiales bacterium]
MPIKSCTLPDGKAGFKWGDSGKCYAARADAVRQAQAAYAHGFVEKDGTLMDDSAILKNLERRLGALNEKIDKAKGAYAPGHPFHGNQFSRGNDPTANYEARVRALEAKGLTTSDAQGVVDAEIMASERAKGGFKLTQRLSSGGVPYNKPSAAVQAKFRSLGGKVHNVTDKTLDMVFPTQAAAHAFMAYARQKDGKHAVFD